MILKIYWSANLDTRKRGRFLVLIRLKSVGFFSRNFCRFFGCFLFHRRRPYTEAQASAFKV